MITLVILVTIIVIVALIALAIFAIGISGLALVAVLFSDVLVLIGLIWIIKKFVCRKGKKAGKSK